GKGVEPRLLDLDAREIEGILHHWGHAALLNLSLEGNGGTQLAMIADHQPDVLGRGVLHVDLKTVRLDQTVTTTVPLRLVGTSPGVKAGGILEQLLDEVEVQALPQAIPDHIEVDISGLHLHEHISVADVVAPDGVKILNDPHTHVAACLAVRRAVEEAAPAAEEAAPAPGAGQES
ncbi:MAG TPA: 50S ribosomal protein L25, partial [Candidatus Nitrosotenuis sp.]|nr:50S ribosomal protein L25 [Candidatus Nitrosotenuis sp.]